MSQNNGNAQNTQKGQNQTPQKPASAAPPTVAAPPQTPAPASAAPASAEGDSSEKVGDTLRKERLTRRITVETIAKDLKLNVNYIKALEASDYTALPADPYVRVYIKSLTKYLSLNTDAIMKKFYREQGLTDDDKAANKIDITVQKQEKNSTAIIAAIIVVVMAVFAFIANQRGWLTQADPQPRTTQTAPAEQETSESFGELDAIEDSSLAIMNAPHDTSAASKAPPRP